MLLLGALLPLVAACGSGQAGGPQAGSAAPPVTAAAPSCLPAGCAPPSPEGRVEPAPGDLADAQAALPRARAALEPLLEREPPTDHDVSAALVRAGFPRKRVHAVGHGVGIAVGGVQVSVSYGTACLHGEVTTQRVTLEAGGALRSEGCVPTALGG